MIVVGRVGSYPTTKYNTVGKYAYELSKHSRTKSYIVTPRYSGDHLPLGNVKGVRSYRVWARRDFPKNHILKKIANVFWTTYMLFVQLRIITYFANKQIQVVHIHSQMYTLVAVWARLMKKKVFITFHGEDYNRLERSKLLKSLLFPYDCVFVISPTMLAGVAKWFKRSVFYTPNGVDVDFYKDLGLARARDILSVGSFKKVKRHKELLDGFAYFLQKDNTCGTRLILAGDGPLESTLRRQVADLGIGGHVIFKGYMTASELVQEYNKSELLVLTSEREGFPKVILEGLSCGIRAVTTKVGAVTEVLGNGYPLYIEDMSPKGIGEKLQQALNVSSADEIDITKYSWDALREEIFSHYVERN